MASRVPSVAPSIDQDDLVGMADLLLANGCHATVKLGHPADFIVARHDNGQRNGTSRGDLVCLHQKPSSHGQNGNRPNLLENR